MENIQTFSLKRVYLLIQKTVYENAKFVLIGLSTIFGIFSVILFLNALGDADAWQNMQGFYVAGFVLSGLFISGMAFTSLRSKEKTMTYLSLPASTLEKFISELLITTVGFAIIYTLIFYAFNFVVFIIGAPFNLDANIINLFDLHVLEGFMYYVIFQSILLAGAATFRKVPLFFTSFTLFIAGVIIMIVVVIIAFSMKDYFDGLDHVNISLSDTHYDVEGEMKNSFFLFKLPKFMFYYLTAPIFWVVTYLKLKEKEV